MRVVRFVAHHHVKHPLMWDAAWKHSQIAIVVFGPAHRYIVQDVKYVKNCIGKGLSIYDGRCTITKWRR